MEVEGKSPERFQQRVRHACEVFKTDVADALDLQVELLTFHGPHLIPAGGGYAPLDFLHLGLTEKLERGIAFLLIVTEVDLAATTLSYTLAMPSQLTNVAVVSTKRLGPEFWGRPPDEPSARRSLSTLLMHSFGHLLNLPHDTDPRNVMFDFAEVPQLANMDRLTAAQRERMRRNLPREAHERTGRRRSGAIGRAGFILATLWHDRGSITHAVARANPLRLLLRLPTMITAALSVIIVVFFSPEVWDVASTVELYQLLGFSLLAILTATLVLYRGFAFAGLLTLQTRRGGLAESTVVTAAATAICLALTIGLLFLAFMALSYLGTLTIFPRKLMESWPTVDPAVRTLDHLKLSLFVAALGTLAGSLGGRADSKALVQAVLFIDEET